MHYIVYIVSLDDWIAVAPHRENTARDKNSARLVVETIVIQPMQRLGSRYQINGLRGEPAIISGRYPVLDPGVRFGLRELRRACISRNDPIESCGQSASCLTTSSGAIPREADAGSDCSQPIEQLRRIFRPVPRVERRLRGKLVAE